MAFMDTSDKNSGLLVEIAVEDQVRTSTSRKVSARMEVFELQYEASSLEITGWEQYPDRSLRG
jgi:hypothetical protein